MTKTVGIIGAGITGLEVARRLAAAGRSVTVLEAEAEAGGQARAFSFLGQSADRFPHTLTPVDGALLEVLEELGLSGDIRWGYMTIGYYLDGKLITLSRLRSLLRHRGLSLLAKLRFLRLRMISPGLRQWERLETIPAGPWLRATLGEEGYGKLLEPLVKKAFGPQEEAVSAASVWAALVRGSPEFRLSPGAGPVGILLGGVEGLARRQAQSIQADGGALRLGFRVKGIRRDAQGLGFLVTGQTGETLGFDELVAAQPVPTLVPLLDGFPEPWIAELRRLRYRSILCVALGVEQPPSDCLRMNVVEPEVPFFQVVALDRIPGTIRPGGLHLLHLLATTDQEDPLWSAQDSAIADEFVQRMGRIFPRLGSIDPSHRWIHRMADVIPVHSPGLGERIARWPPPPPGFHLGDPGIERPFGSSLDRAISVARRIFHCIQESSS